MANKLNYDGKSLLNIKFSPDQKGYDPLEVDQVLDKIIKDYETLNSAINELVDKLQQQKGQYDKLKEEFDRVQW